MDSVAGLVSEEVFNTAVPQPKQQVPVSEECRIAIQNRDIELLKKIHGSHDTCAHAAAHGHLACLRLAHESGCEWDVTTCAVAAGGGYLDCLMYAFLNGCPWDRHTCSAAA